MHKLKISAICFDMWETLCPGGGQKQWDELQEILRADFVDKKTFLKLGEESLLMHSWSLKEGIRNLIKNLKLKMKNENIDEAYECWWRYVQKSKPYPEVTEALNKLKQDKQRMFIISNTDVESFNFKIKKLGWEKYFERFFLSSEIGVLKPSVKIFETVQRYLNVPKAQIIMVDDSLYYGIYPAKRFGWKALWIAREKEGKHKGKIEDLKGILDFI